MAATVLARPPFGVLRLDGRVSSSGTTGGEPGREVVGRHAGADVVMIERVGPHGGAFWRQEFPSMVAWAFGP
jgi:hypothetical protein